MSGIVKVCGERGLVTSCPACKDWEPIALTPVHDAVIPVKTPTSSAFCATCQQRLTRVQTYNKKKETAS